MPIWNKTTMYFSISDVTSIEQAKSEKFLKISFLAPGLRKSKIRIDYGLGPGAKNENLN